MMGDRDSALLISEDDPDLEDRWSRPAPPSDSEDDLHIDGDDDYLLRIGGDHAQQPRSLDNDDDDDDDDDQHTLLVSSTDEEEKIEENKKQSWLARAGQLLLHGPELATVSRWTLYQNICVAMALSFFGEASRGLVIPSKWPYLESMGADRAFYGRAVALFSLTRMLGSLLLGYLADRVPVKTLSLACLAICLLGNLMYSLAALDPDTGKWIILASRGVIGLGSSVVVLVRTHTAIVSPPDRRTRFFSWGAAAAYCGIALLPGLGTFLSYVAFSIGDLPVNGNTAPGLLLVIVYIFVIIFTSILMDPYTGKTKITFDAALVPPTQPIESSQPIDSTLSTPSTPSSESSEVSESTEVTPSSQLIESNNQSIRSIESPHHQPKPPSWTDEVDQTFLQRCWANRSLYGHVAFFFFVNFSARICIALIETTGTPMWLDVTHHSITPESISAASSFFFWLGLGGLFVFPLLELAERFVSGSLLLLCAFVLIAVGCFLQAPYGDTPVPYAQFVVANTLVWAIGSPVTQVLVVSGLVGILGGQPPGAYMGLITAGGSLARIVGPIFATSANYQLVFSVIGGLSLFTALLLAIFYLKKRWQDRQTAQ